MNLQIRKGPVYLAMSTVWGQLAIALTYLFVSYYIPDFKFAPLIIAGWSLFNICLAIFLKPYKNSLRLLFNHSLTFLIFLCYFMIR